MYDHQRGASNSNEDLTKKISHSIYITNFPDSVTSHDLRRECSNYGTVVDVFILLKKSKAGRRFAFVRFIKVFNLDRLVENLCTIWIGRHHLYANKVRFERPQRSNALSSNDTFKATDKHGSHLRGRQHSDDSCIIECDFSNHVMGKVNDFHSINDLHTLIKDEGFANAKILYLGGLWVMLEFDNRDVKSNFMQHIGVKSWFNVIQEVSQNFVSDERIVWVDLEGIPIHAWSQVVYSSDNDSVQDADQSQNNDESGDDNGSDIDGMEDAKFDGNLVPPLNSTDEHEVQQSEDPFELYDLLKKNKTRKEIRDPSPSLSHPP
nr:hypothetical protein [Tanacetum cinerariifolium]